MQPVLTAAREIAGGCGSELHLVHVREIAPLPVFPAATIGYPGIGLPEMGMTGSLPGGYAMRDEPNEKGKSRIEQLGDEIARQGLAVTVHEREGTVVEQILETARELGADLIVMGSHGHGSVYNLLVGSVTEGVIKAAERPVLLVPSPKEAQ